MAICAFSTLIWLILIVIAFDWFSVAFFLFAVQGIFGFRGSLYRVRVSRAEYRELKYKEWLFRPIPELEPPIDWAEIERATAALLAKGVEPTYERARDWLRVDAKQRACDHGGEWIQIDGFDTLTCIGCGFEASREVIEKYMELKPRPLNMFRPLLSDERQKPRYRVKAKRPNPLDRLPD